MELMDCNGVGDIFAWLSESHPEKIGPRKSYDDCILNALNMSSSLGFYRGRYDTYTGPDRRNANRPISTQPAVVDK